MNPQFVKSPSGEDMVLLSRADYETLVTAAEEAAEDAADVAMYDARKADPLGSAPMPAEITRHMREGARLLKAIRLWKDIGQVKLAYDLGTSQGFISDLENGRRKLTPELAKRMAAALDVPEHWLI
ncbi:MAG: helix-turn-helix transcriptional regulator [Devosia nanyangense]|uniref:Helix-turn-helix transcriptional regulator n=1 Tax=Devosia nanyangense TaxID=1228055 RepID=A0A933NY11_9HYPH|nr:helix-turn-helix transcriptional regulator [Devosia nanyangense]